MPSCEVRASGQKWKHRHGRKGFSLFDAQVAGQPAQASFSTVRT